jgi:hypothetical protein
VNATKEVADLDVQTRTDAGIIEIMAIWVSAQAEVQEEEVSR